jgi:hypothetical protein
VTKGGKDNPAMQQAKNDGTLPVEDHNTRIIAFGDDLQDVQTIADALAKEAFDNVAFFAGSTWSLRWRSSSLATSVFKIPQNKIAFCLRVG